MKMGHSKNRKHLLTGLTAGLCAVMAVKACAAPVDSVSITSVSFPASHALYRDTGNQNAYSSIHWMRGRNADEQSPVCYARNTDATVEAYFAVSPATATQPIQIRGLAGAHEFEAKIVTPQNGLAQYDDDADPNLPNAVHPGDSFSIRWQYSKDNGVNWLDAGTSTADAYSTNQMYVTLDNPAQQTEGKLFHTVVDVGCRNGAQADSQNLTLEQYKVEVFKKIWEDFKAPEPVGIGQAPNVLRQDNTVMTYYGNNKDNRTDTTSGLLNDADGHCDGWVNFMRDALAAQTITCSSVHITPPPRPGYVGRIELKAASAQGKQVAPTTYNFHRVIQYDGISTNALYDPSYGRSYETATPKLDWENAALLRVFYRDAYGAVVAIVPNETDTLQCNFE